jgi:hypothetical protein
MTKEKMNTEELFNKLSLEKKTGELLPLDPNIYKEQGNNIKEENENSATSAENKNKILNMLRARRLQKILTYIAYGRPLPHQIPEEEERLYIHIKKIIEDESTSTKSTKIRITADTPEIITTEGRKLGPFDKNTVIEIENQQDLEFLIKNKIGEAT